MMKKQFLLLSVAVAAMFAGCSKSDSGIEGGDPTAPATQISAKSSTRGSIDTKAPVTGTSLDGLTAQVYALTTKLSVNNDTNMFSNAYGRGTMTFDDSKYVGFDKGSLAGKDGGKSLLPQNPTAPVYLYGFYPNGWNQIGENLVYEFYGNLDLMCTYLTTADDVEIQYNAAPIADKGELVFKHLLTRYNIQVKAESADAATAWGSVKSVALKDAATASNNVAFGKSGLVYSKGNPQMNPAFFKLTGTAAAPTYTDTKFEAADFTASQPLNQTVFNAFDNACYSMLAPVTVDTDKATPEITLEVVTMAAAGGKETKTEVKVSLDQTKFAAPFSTRGYSVTITLNFRAGAIQAIASVEEWKDGGSQNEDVDGTVPTPPTIGEMKDGGIVYEVNGSKAKVLSLDEGTNLKWVAQNTYVIGTAGQSNTDGKANVAAMKAYSTDNTANADDTKKTTGVFATDFPAAHFCESKNTGGVTGWYLPAKNELVALYNAYTTNKTAIDAGIANNSGTAISASGTFWSSTESNYGPSLAWSVVFANGGTSNGGKSSDYYVRCVREL